MLSLEEIRALAAQKQGYRPDRVGAAPTAPSVGSRLRNDRAARRVLDSLPTTPSVLGGSGSADMPSGGIEIDWSKPASSNDGGGFNPLGALGSAVASGFGEVISLADIGRRAYQGVTGEIGDFVEGAIPGNTPLENIANAALGNPFQLRGHYDENGEYDTDFEWGEIRRAITGDESLNQGFAGRSPWMQDLPGPVKAVAGFAGDIATDPLTYLSAGTLKGATIGGKLTAKAAAEAALPATRLDLAIDVGRILDKKAAEGGLKIGKEAADKLRTEVGTKGRGALTRQNLARLDIDPKALAEDGLRADFGYTTGVRSKRVNIPGTRRLAEASENTKGRIKQWAGRKKGSKIADDLFKAQDYAEADLKRAVLSGQTNSGEAARRLAMMNEGKGNSRGWTDQTHHALRNLKSADGVKLADVDEAMSRAIVDGLERGDRSVPLVAELIDFFKEAGISMKRFGVDFEMMDEGYVPYRLSDEAKAAKAAGDEAVLDATDVKRKSRQAFQLNRDEGGTIAERNAAWRAKGHDYDLLKTDIHELLGDYLQEGSKAAMMAPMMRTSAPGIRGAVMELDQGIDAKKANAKIAKFQGAQKEQLEKAGKARRAAVREARDVARRERAVASKELDRVTKLADDAENQFVEVNARLNQDRARLASTERALQMSENMLRTARSQEKGKLTRKIKSLRSDREGLLKSIEVNESKLGRFQGQRRRLEGEIAAARTSFDEKEKLLLEAEDLRKAADEAPVFTDAQDAADEVVARTEAVAAAVDQVSNSTDAVLTAANTAGWIRADSNRVADRATRLITDIDAELSKSMKDLPSKGRFGSAEQRDYLSVLREQTATWRKVLQESDDPAMKTIAKLELQANVAEFAAWKSGQSAKEVMTVRHNWTEARKLTSDPKFQDLISLQTRDGFREVPRQVGDNVQVAEWYDDALRKIDRLTDPETASETWKAANAAMDKYRKGLNWWKGWAVTSPGFLFRNLYSGMFNMYLDDVNPMLARKYYRFYNKTKALPEDQARKVGLELFKGDARTVDLMLDARRASSATGGGQTVAEFNADLLQPTNWNPFSANNKAVAGVRELGSDVEQALRGGHAFGILSKGGSFDTAVSRVQKFQFNYTDIGRADRVMKNVMPFWMFFSRNIGLQAQVFAKNPNKITRSYVNAKRNIENMEGTDMGVPVADYITRSMAGIATNVGKLPGFPDGQMFITPDIPSVRFPDQMAQLVDDLPRELMSGAAPAFKVPYQLLTNQDAFLGREYNDGYETYGDDGEWGPRKAHDFLQIPGLESVIGALPGFQRVGNDVLATDRAGDVFSEINPLIGRWDSFSGPRPAQTAAGFMGAPIRSER